MGEPTEGRCRVINQRDQPVELHLCEGVVVLPPHGAAEIDAADLETPQVRQLRRQAMVITTSVEGEAEGE